MRDSHGQQRPEHINGTHWSSHTCVIQRGLQRWHGYEVLILSGRETCENCKTLLMSYGYQRQIDNVKLVSLNAASKDVKLSACPALPKVIIWWSRNGWKLQKSVFHIVAHSSLGSRVSATSRTPTARIDRMTLVSFNAASRDDTDIKFSACPALPKVIIWWWKNGWKLQKSVFNIVAGFLSTVDRHSTLMSIDVFCHYRIFDHVPIGSDFASLWFLKFTKISDEHWTFCFRGSNVDFFRNH